MNFSYNKGQRLILELSDSNIVEGTYESGTNSRIDLINIVECETRKTIKGKLSFYKNEITSVKILEQDIDNEKIGSPTKLNGEHNTSSNVINLRRAEFERLQEMTQNYMYLATMDQRYLEAISYLNNCENIGIVGLGADFQPNKTIDLLILSSWDQVYIFDLLSYRKMNFPPDLKELLESELIKKVGHDLMMLVECLWYCHKISLKNFFDTQLADVKISRQNENGPPVLRTLPECLNTYFNFPSSMLVNAKKTISSKWGERPLSSSRKVKAALLVTYLIILKNKQERLLLKDYYDLIDEYTKTIHESNSYQAYVKLNSDGITDGIRKLLQ